MTTIRPPRRVLLFPSLYAPAVGGVEELTRHLALTLVSMDFAVEVWSPAHPAHPAPAVELMDGIVIRRFSTPLPSASVKGSAIAFLGAAKSLAAMVVQARRFRPDVIHVQCFGPNGIYATALAEILRVPLIVTSQGETMMDDNDVFEHSTSLRTGLRIGLRRANVVTGCSAFTLADLEKRFGLPARSGQVIFNGVQDNTTVQSDMQDLDFPFQRYVLALGRVVAKKGFDLLLAAFAEVADRHSDVGLVIGGTGSAEGDLREAAKALGVESRVHFAGRLNRQQVAAAMAAAEIFVMPSRLEPFGIVVLEGWRAGTAVIATNRGGPPEFVSDGEDGILVDPFDRGAFSKALDHLLGDDAYRSSIARRGKDKVGEFDWARIAEQYKLLYETTTASRGRRSGLLDQFSRSSWTRAD